MLTSLKITGQAISLQDRVPNGRLERVRLLFTLLDGYTLSEYSTKMLPMDKSHQLLVPEMLSLIQWVSISITMQLLVPPSNMLLMITL
jgi:hypothetical protein